MASWYKYQNQIKSGDLIIWSTNKVTKFEHVISIIIRMFTMSEYNHVGIAWKPTNDVSLVFEAITPKVVLTPLEREIPFYHIPMNIEFTEAHRNFLLSKLGTRYSHLQAIKAYYSKAKHAEYTICTDLIMQFYNFANRPIEVDNYRPSEIVRGVLKAENTSITKVAE